VRLVVCPPLYFPPLSVLALAARADRFAMGDTFVYSRQSGMNRMRIRSTAGAMWLTVPVGTAHGRRVDEVRLDGWPEAARHAKKALRFGYGKAPFYEHYIDDLHALFDTPFATLADLTVASTAWLFERFGLDAPLRASALPGAPGDLAAVVEAVSPSSLVALPEALAHDRAAVATPVEAMAWTEPTYRQPFPGFVSGLSAVDALLMRGPRARDLLGG